MKSIPKLIRRFVGLLLLSTCLLFLLNIVLLAIYAAGQPSSAGPWKNAERLAESLEQTKDGGYALSVEQQTELLESGIWAVLLDNHSQQVIWKSENLPENIPLTYTLSEVVSMTRGYIDGYPTFSAGSDKGLLVLGYPRESYWKHMWPSWNYQTIAQLPRTVLFVLAVNILLLLLIYITANAKLLHSVKPIVAGIQALATGEIVHIREKGVLSELAVNINKTSGLLQEQKQQLRRKETARANWIAGVSHDIRTPLSMVMGYAGQLQENVKLLPEERQKAGMIVMQSERIRNLINDLNLASKLEYNMQPIRREKQNLVALVRQVVVDFINMDMSREASQPYELKWETDTALTACPIYADKELLKRAISNLIHNSIRHNVSGCTIYVSVSVMAQGERVSVTVADDGVGATDEQLAQLNHAPHYMVCDENITEQRHGLGLLLVKQIAAAHGGEATFTRSSFGGFQVQLTLPIAAEE